MSKKKENKKQKKTSIKSAILVLLLMALLLITSSYAWFTANQTVTISQLQVNVEASNGLQISADAQNWKTVLEKQDLVTAGSTYQGVLINQLPETGLAPVSTSGNVSTGKMDIFYGDAKANSEQGGKYFLSSTKQTDTNGAKGKYIAFDLFLKVDADTTIYMTSASKVSMVDTDKGLKNAARVAFVNEGHNIASTAPETLRGLNMPSGKADIWEPNYDVHTENAVAAARDTYNISTTTTGAEAITYFGIKDEIPGDTVEMKQTTGLNPNGTYFEQVTPKYKTTAENASDIEFVRLTAGVTKIRVYMWVEGQDVDCENSASGSDITFDLQFTATAPGMGA